MCWIFGFGLGVCWAKHWAEIWLDLGFVRAVVLGCRRGSQVLQTNWVEAWIGLVAGKADHGWNLTWIRVSSSSFPRCFSLL